MNKAQLIEKLAEQTKSTKAMHGLNQYLKK
jgi:hypothetical protein